MKKVFISAFMVLTLVLVSACGSSGSSPSTSSDQRGSGNETFTLTFNSSFPAQDDPQDPQYAATMKFMKLVEERTDGRVKMEYYPNGQLVGQAESADALADGTIDMQNTTPNAWADRIPEGGFTTLSYLAMGEEHMNYLMRETEFGKLYEQALEEYGIKPLHYWQSGMTGFLSNKPIAKKEDFKGLIIASNDRIMNEYLSSMGAGIASIPYADSYEALQRGTVDTIQWGYLVLEKYNMHEVVDYISAVPHNYPQLGLIAISLKAWNRLPEDLQQIILETSREVEKETILLSKKLDERTLAYVKKSDVEIVPMTKEDYNELVTYAKQTQWEAFAKQNDRTAKMVQIAKQVEEQWKKDYPDASIFIE